MTYQEFGLQLRKVYPQLNTVPLDHAALAQYFLNLYPEYYDAISPTARKVKELTDKPIRYPDRRWFEGSGQAGLNHAQAIQNRRSHIAMLHEAEMVIWASEQKVPVTALHEIAIVSHVHAAQKDLLTHQYQLEKAKDNDAMDIGNREILTPHEIIDSLEDKLMTLIDRHDAETHPKKKRALKLRVNRLMEELDGLSSRAAVQAKDRQRVERSDAGSYGEGSLREETEEKVEPVSTEKSRVGF